MTLDLLLVGFVQADPHEPVPFLQPLLLPQQLQRSADLIGAQGLERVDRRGARSAHCVPFRSTPMGFRMPPAFRPPAADRVDKQAQRGDPLIPRRRMKSVSAWPASVAA
jgi:hypothetical protein